jgi:putative phage-type endonuclease
MSPVELLAAHEAVRDNPRWHEIRRQGVTASEIPVILGLSTWDSPWSLWHRKRGLIIDDDSESAGWGRRLEPVIVQAWAEQHADLVAAPAGLYRHREREWQMATPDALVLGGDCNCGAAADVLCSCIPDTVGLLECKHPYDWTGWGDDGTDDVPAAYAAQTLWQLDVMDLDVCHLAAYSRHSMREYLIRRDAEDAVADLELMRKLALEFLRSAEPPPLDGHPATLRAVKALHPDLEDREQEVTNRVAVYYEVAVRELDAAKARAKHAEAELRAAAGNARYILNPQGEKIATRSVYDRKGYWVKPTTVNKLIPARKDTTHEQDR